MEAKVKWFQDSKGYGYATLSDGRDVFIHYTEIQEKGHKTLQPGQEIELDLYEDPRGLCGKNVRIR